MAKRDHIETMASMPSIARAWAEAHHGQACTDHDIQRLYDSFLPVQLEVISRYCELIPCAANVISHLRRQGIKIGSSTGYPRTRPHILMAMWKRSFPKTAGSTSKPPPGPMDSILQGAIDKIIAMTPLDNGFRGVVQLEAGEFIIEGPLFIRHSGVVLRGVGADHDTLSASIIKSLSRKYRSTILTIAPDPHPQRTITTAAIRVLDSYVPTGAVSFRIDQADAFTPDDRIIVRRPGTAQWIAAMQMDQLNSRFGDSDWAPHHGVVDLHFERTVVAIDGNRLSIDAGLPCELEQGHRPFGGGEVFGYTHERLENIGIENLRGMCEFYSDTDEAHPFTFIAMDHVENSWVRAVTGRHLGYAVVTLGRESRNITAMNLWNLRPQSRVKGTRRYAFDNSGQYNLMRDLFAEQGRHDFVNNSPSRGPNVFFFGRAVDQKSPSGLHQRWSVGTLYDNLVIKGHVLAVHNRGSYGSGHGHAGGSMVFWNCRADATIVENPPTSQNWAIGATGGPVHDYVGYVDSAGKTVDLADPQRNARHSLYIAQRHEFESIGYPRCILLGDFDESGTSGPNDPIDRPAVSQAWAAEAAAWASRHQGVVHSMDEADVSDKPTITPLSFKLPKALDRKAVFAQLTIGVSTHRADSRLWFGDEKTSRALADMDLSNPAQAYTLGGHGIVVVECAAEGGNYSIDLLKEGLLSIALTHAQVDWAELRVHYR